MRTAAALAKGGHDIDVAVRPGRARISKLAAALVLLKVYGPATSPGASHDSASVQWSSAEFRRLRPNSAKTTPVP